MADGAGVDKHGAAARRLLGALRAAERRRLALWAPVAFGVGVQVYFLWPSEPALEAALVAPLAATALWAATWRRAVAGVAALALLLAALGFSAGVVRARQVAAPVLVAQTEALVEGRVRAISQSAAGRPRLLLEGPRIWGLAAASTPARVRVTLLSARDAQGLKAGDWVSVVARLAPPGGPVEPGAFDFARAAWFERLGGVGVARSRVARIAGPPPDGLAARARVAMDRFRAELSHGLRARMGGDAGAFAAAVVTGDRAGLPVEALEALRDSNLAHLLAISGLHMAIVCGLAFGAVRFGLALTPGVGVRARVKAVAAVAALAAGLGYLAISGAAVTTQRAFLMAAVVFAAMLVDRPAVTLRALALAALVIMALAPESLTQVGFQMSFAATVALVAAYEAARRAGLLARRPGFWDRPARFALGLVLTSLIAGLATAPFAAFHFNRVTSYGLLANLAAVPAMGAVVAPALGAAAVLASFGLEGPALWVAAHGVDWILAVAFAIAGLEGAARTVAAPPALALWCVVAGGLWLCLWRGPIRLAGMPALALAGGLWLWPPARPTLLIAPQAAAVGVMTPTGRAVDPDRPDRFAAETWLRRDGDDASVVAAISRPAFVDEGAWRIAAHASGWEVAVFRGARLSDAGLARQCGPRRIVIAPNVSFRAAPPSEGCVAFDRPALETQGAIAIWIDPQGAIRRMAASRAGLRPWTHGGDPE